MTIKPSPGSDVQPERQLGKQTKSDSDDRQDACTENAVTVQLAHFFGTPARESSCGCRNSSPHFSSGYGGDRIAFHI